MRKKELDLLAIREHSREELKQKLCQKDFAADEIDTLLETLAKEDLQSDSRFVAGPAPKPSR